MVVTEPQPSREHLHAVQVWADPTAAAARHAVQKQLWHTDDPAIENMVNNSPTTPSPQVPQPKSKTAKARKPTAAQNRQAELQERIERERQRLIQHYKEVRAL